MNFFTHDQQIAQWEQAQTSPEKAREVYLAWFNSVKGLIWNLAGGDEDWIAEFNYYLWTVLKYFNPQRGSLTTFVWNVLKNHKFVVWKKSTNHNVVACSLNTKEGDSFDVEDKKCSPTLVTEYEEVLNLLKKKVDPRFLGAWWSWRMDDEALKSIGNRMGITGERARQLISRVDKFIRKGGLQGEFDWYEPEKYMDKYKKRAKTKKEKAKTQG